MLTFAVVVAVIIAVVGIFRWKRLIEPSIQAVERNGRKAWAKRNKDEWMNKGKF